jgi:hypothetical protein
LKSLLALLVALAALLTVAQVANAQTGDSVTGTAATGFGRGYTVYTFDVHSGPRGEQPTGTVKLVGLFGSTSPGTIGPLEVSCLTVNGNRASMFAPAPPNSSGIAALAISVEDNGSGQDGIDFHTVATLPDDCPVPSAVSEPTASGDITVTDAPPPTVYAQCRFERVATGITAFRAKYGLGPNHDHAMRHCVRLYSGF